MVDVREEGIAALGRGDDEAAVALLAEACRLAPDDFPAHLGLGQVLLRTAQAHEAVTVLERAVALVPPSPDARRELGLALAAAGRTQEALRALQHALTLRPNDRVALAALDRLRQQATPPLEVSSPIYSAITRHISLDPAGGDLPALPAPTVQSGSYQRRATLLDPDADSGELTQPLPSVAPGDPPGSGLTGHEPTLYVMASALGQPVAEQAIPHYGFPATTPGPVAGPPWLGTVAPTVGRYDDEFSIIDGYYNLLEILASPRDFCYTQIGREGNRAPLAMLVTYALNIAIGLLAVLFTTGSHLGPSGMFVVLLSPIWFLLLYIVLATGAVGGATALHAACAVFRGRASYSGSFRAAVYAAAPVCTAIAVGLILSPIKPHNDVLASLLTLLPYALAVVAPLWSVLLVGIAIHYIHALPLRSIVSVLLLLTALGVGCAFGFSLLPTWN